MKKRDTSFITAQNVLYVKRLLGDDELCRYCPFTKERLALISKGCTDQTVCETKCYKIFPRLSVTIIRCPCEIINQKYVIKTVKRLLKDYEQGRIEIAS